MNIFDDSGGWIPPNSTRTGGRRPRRNNNFQLPPRWRALFYFLAGLIVALILLWAYLFLMLQPYTPITSNNEIALATVHQSREGLHQISVQLTHFDANRYEKVDKPYLIQGDKVVLKYEYVTFPDWLGFFGLHSGYILIGLQGYYTDGSLGTYLPLGTPDQNQFLLVSPHFSSVTFTPGGKTHALYMSQAGLYEP